VLKPYKQFGSVALGIATVLGATSANAVVMWDQETAERYGIEQPYEYTPAGDCSYFLQGNLSPEAGTAARFEIWQRLGSGEEFPLIGMAPGQVAIWDTNTQRLIGYPVVGGEETREIANFTYTSQEAGQHTIGVTDYDPNTDASGESHDMYTAYIDGVGNVQLGERWCEGSAQVAWAAPPVVDPNSTVGKITGGGWIADRKNNFGFNAQFDTVEGLKGHLTYIDKNYGKLESTALDYLLISGTHATLVGVGALNDQPVSFTMEVDDLGEPGTGRDQFKITWTGGYGASGVLNGGNIQIHQ